MLSWDLERITTRVEMSNARHNWLRGGMSSGLVIFLWVLLAPKGLGAQEPKVTRTPKLSALVRVVAPKLGPDWKVGMFNRVRVEPPCYVVLLFSTDGEYRLSETLPLADLERLQVHRVYDDQFPLSETWTEVAGPEYWINAPLDSLQRVNERQCPETLGG